MLGGVVISGYLHKKGPTAKHGWKLRFFALQGQFLRYYKKESDTKELGCVQLSKVINLWTNSSSQEPPRPAYATFMFCLDTMQSSGIPRAFLLCALTQVFHDVLDASIPRLNMHSVSFFTSFFFFFLRTRRINGVQHCKAQSRCTEERGFPSQCHWCKIFTFNKTQILRRLCINWLLQTAFLLLLLPADFVQRRLQTDLLLLLLLFPWRCQ